MLILCNAFLVVILILILPPLKKYSVYIRSFTREPDNSIFLKTKSTKTNVLITCPVQV